MKTFTSLALCVLLAAVSVTAQLSMRELAEITEEFRVRFDELHDDKDDFVRLTRVLTRAELKGLNEATLVNLGNARNDIDDALADTREQIANAILEPNANEECLLGLVDRVIEEGRRAGEGMSACAADKINIKEGLGDEFRTLTNTLQRIATAASEYTLYTFAIHNSFTDPDDHVEWLEENYANQVDFWDNVARPEAQEDLDNLEINRPALVEENRVCLAAVVTALNTALNTIQGQINSC
uniref:Protein TsetseEP domain-containing protein n=1 Tax=Anopheles epiroticus TaxID=199890 RepID=A0A182P632_9DIPT